MQIATWNVNSIKVRLQQVLDWLETSRTDVLLMQEIKTPDEAFPAKAFEEAGFRVLFNGQKTYNGVAIAARANAVTALEGVVRNIPGYPDAQKRLIAATLVLKDGRKLRTACAYFPNGQEVGCDKYLYKLEWIAALTLWVRSELAREALFVLGGDFNIAPTDADLWDPLQWKGKTPASEPERNAWAELLKTGLMDTWAQGLHAPETYSWWDYRMSGFEKNQGMRIDHLLASPALVRSMDDVWIDAAPRALEKPSDHAPVVMRINDAAGAAERESTSA